MPWDRTDCVWATPPEGGHSHLPYFFNENPKLTRWGDRTRERAPGREHTDTWFFFGDSITLGVNDSEQPGGFVSRLALLGAREGAYSLPPATFYNLGARRQRLSQIEARFEQEYTARLMPGIRPRLAFCTGTVDINP